jgi:subtilisin family serine protease
VAVKVLSRSAPAASDIAAGLDWVLSNHAALGIRAVNMSLGDSFQHRRSDRFPCRNTNVANAIKSLHDEGVAVFVASGNNGFDQGISFPACVAEAISVGGVYDATFGSVSWCRNASCSQILCTDAATAADGFVCHASSGPILDLLAPDWKTTTSRLGGGTLDAGGTSLATPYAAGAAALLFEADPTLTAGEVEALLEGHGPLVTNPDSGLSFPRFDVGDAVDEVLGP